MIDLHIHTTASDGVYSPEKILEMAADLGLEAISITDHDTLDGSRKAFESTGKNYPEVLTGVEISTCASKDFNIFESIHILGYRIDLYNKSLEKDLLLLQNSRKNRNPLIVEKLREHGVDISMESLEAFSGNVQIGRAHIGRYLFEKGYVKNVEEAFSQYLGKGRPCYVDKYKIPVETAIEKIILAGGVPVIAHPGLIKNYQKKDFACFFEYLKDHGLKGIEVFYPSHSESFRSFCVNESKRLGLISTGGSDFHGYKNEGLVLGRGRNNLKVPYSVYKSILEL
ncbi:MAG: PHP domain-containing protein [Desulfobacteraceae bacterium]|nr:PHP domain-containing protein [Desulfobacteraceae bacterium]